MSNLKIKIKSIVKEELSKLEETAPGTSPNFAAGYKLGKQDLLSGSWGSLADKYEAAKRAPNSRSDVLDFEKGYIAAAQEQIESLRQKIDFLYSKIEEEGFDFEEKVLNKLFPEPSKQELERQKFQIKKNKTFD